MKRRLAMALAFVALVGMTGLARAQAPTQCGDFLRLRNEAQSKALAVRQATAHKADRKEVCTLIKRYSVAEAAVLRFLEVNKVWCGVPEQAIALAKANHAKTLKFRTAACTEAPLSAPRQPTLSDAIGTPSVDTGGNTSTGRGTFDSLNGNPLAR